MIGTTHMAIRDIPEDLLPLAREVLRRNLADTCAQQMLYGHDHPQAPNLAQAVRDARRLWHAIALPESEAA